MLRKSSPFRFFTFRHFFQFLPRVNQITAASIFFDQRLLKITSRDNQRIKTAAKVRDGKIKNLLFIEGIRLCEEILRSNISINEIFYSENFRQNERAENLFNKLTKLSAESFEVSENIFNSLSDTKNSQGIILICEKPFQLKKIFEDEIKKASFRLVLLLHEINNPNNLGAILRTAEAAGVSGLILTRNSANPFSPKALRASMGSALRMPILENVDFVEILAWAKSADLETVCADVNAEKSYTEIDWKKPKLLIFGSEAHGLSVEERENIQESMIIPMENGVESLNLAVSGGIILFEAKRQRDKKL